VQDFTKMKLAISFVDFVCQESFKICKGNVHVLFVREVNSRKILQKFFVMIAFLANTQTIQGVVYVPIVILEHIVTHPRA